MRWAILSHWSAMVIHECSHNLAAKTPMGNRLIALFANLPMVIPAVETFRRYHIAHHAHLGEWGVDTDLAHDLEMKLVGRSWWRKLLWLACYLPVYIVRGATFAKRPSTGELVNLAIQVGACFLIHAWLGWGGLLYLGLSVFFGHSLHPVAAHFIHEHYTFAEGQETFSYYGPLNAVTFNVGYHVEHHDFMNVPGSRLPELNRLAKGFYTDLKSHRCWTGVLVRFIADQTMHPMRRIVRAPRRGGRSAS